MSQREIIEMKITYIKFSEFDGLPAEWSLSGFDLADVNLIVGRNASGKSRLLNVISGLAKLISGKQKALYASAKYEIKLPSVNGDFFYKLELGDEKVLSELLTRDGEVLFARDADGLGTIFAVKAEQNFEFSVPSDLLVIGARRDKLQHPYLEEIHEWASTLRHYRFANTFGQETHAAIPLLLSLEDREDLAFEVGKVHEIYSKGYSVFGDPFDKAILYDLGRLGYSCTDVGADQLNLPQLKGLPVATLYVKEADLSTNTLQIHMSQGMFRALALVIELNYILFRKQSMTVLIDDVGEGLDFERSKSFVSLLKSKAQERGLQLVMTTNDRFVMNAVPLDSWGVIRRDGCKVEVINSKNNKEVFDEFKLLGLSNFDFFADRYFEQAVE